MSAAVGQAGGPDVFEEDDRPYAALVDAYPGLGKSTAVREYGREYWRAQVALRGETTPDGLAGPGHLHRADRQNPHPRAERGDLPVLRAARARRCRHARRAGQGRGLVLEDIRLLDDVHFLAPSRADASAVKMANHLKSLANTFPVTLVCVGVGVAGTGLLTEGRAPRQALQAQFGRRTTVLAMRPFQVYDEPGRQEWRRLLLSVERQLVLAGRYPGMPADDLARGHAGCRVSSWPVGRRRVRPGCGRPGG